MAFTLSSTAFSGGGPIPTGHTCDGADGSPPLTWTGSPEGTASFALIVDDPDAPSGTWVHWVLYDLPRTVTSLPADIPKTDALPRLGEARQGRNDFRRIGYGGPCPPRGPAHHYHFKLYALDDVLGLPAGASEHDVVRAMEGHVLAAAELVATYARR